MIEAIVHVGAQPASSWRKRCSTTMPCGEWTTSGWNCTPQILREALSSAATGASAVEAVATKPSGAWVTASKWLIHTSCVDGQVVQQLRRAVGDLELGPAVLAAHAPTDLAAELLGDQLGAVADAEDRDARGRRSPGRATARRRRGRSSGRRTGSALPADRRRARRR